MIKRSKILIALTLTATALLLLAKINSITSVFAAPSGVVFYVDPAVNYFETGSTPVGFKFNVTVYWNDTGSPLNEAYAYQVNLQYNATLLNCTRAWRPTWDSSWLFYGKSVVGIPPSFGNGYVMVGDSLLGVASASSAHSPLAIFEFQILQAPPEGGQLSCTLNIDNEDTYWLDTDLNTQTPTKTNGTYTYSSPWAPPQPATLYVDPKSIIDSSLTPCNNFTVNVDISNATNLYSFDFKLGFANTILNVLKVELGSFFPSSVAPTITINNTAGYVWVSATLMPPEPPKNGTGTLATITLHVEGNGSSTLRVYDVQIKDEGGRTLPLNTQNGYFNNSAIQGDINGDGKVDVKDVSVVALYLGSYPGHPRWDERADINGDGKVNIFDIAVVCRNFGRI
jgi:hypothetical protein